MHAGDGVRVGGKRRESDVKGREGSADLCMSVPSECVSDAEKRMRDAGRDTSSDWSGERAQKIKDASKLSLVMDCKPHLLPDSLSHTLPIMSSADSEPVVPGADSRCTGTEETPVRAGKRAAAATHAFHA